MILPVLDLMNGQIVRGIGGRRDEYRPIVSTIVDSSEPLDVATALKSRFGFTEFYLADLDAIQQGRLSRNVMRRLADAGFRLWIDAGLRSAEDAAIDMLLQDGADSIVAGLESLKSPWELRRIVDSVGPERTVFSLDLKAGRPVGELYYWILPPEPPDPWQVAQRAIAAGVRRLIVLDLVQVGSDAGVTTEDLCKRLKENYPDVQLTTGGGVRGINDVTHLTDIGVDHVLVASALHDGRITPEDIGV